MVLQFHPFYRLAMTCHTLRAVIESFCYHLLQRCRDILCFEVEEGGLVTKEE
jgi:hypothetical protein